MALSPQTDYPLPAPRASVGVCLGCREASATVTRLSAHEPLIGVSGQRADAFGIRVARARNDRGSWS